MFNFKLYTSSGLVSLSKGIGSKATQQCAVEVGTALFYHLATYVSDDTRYYTPTRQFFSMCIETLGQVRNT